MRVVGGDEAGAVLVPLAAGHAGDDPAVDDNRSARVPVAEPGVGDGVIPDHLAVPGVEGDDVGVVRVHVDLVVVDRDRPRAGAERVVRRPLERLAVLPDEVTGDGVERLHYVQRTGEIHHAVVDEGGRLGDTRRHRPRPHEPELVHVVPVDLIEGAVAPAVERSPPVQPIGRIGVREHGVGDRLEGPVLRRRDAARGGDGRERQCADACKSGSRPSLRVHAGLLAVPR